MTARRVGLRLRGGVGGESEEGWGLPESRASRERDDAEGFVREGVIVTTGTGGIQFDDKGNVDDDR